MDYRSERFTMDDAYVRAVMRFFVHLWHKRWIYRANRIVNWCPFHRTSLSDLELQHQEVDDALSYVRYPFADGDGHITIATVRPSTILADVAVAVHPEDERYRDLVGREVVVPWVERRVPVIADERVEREFGTGALKVTPGHDAPDWNISRQIWWGHQLPLWECPDGHVIVQETEPGACTECGSRELTRSEDVLDTWFSSALWPFATLGWPEDTEDLRTFYPGDLNTTARDIIRLWENRMIFSGLELMGEVPFRDVVIHSLLHAPA